MTNHTETQATVNPLCLQGELTIYAAADLKLEILAHLASNSELEFDLSQVSEIDAAGLQLLILTKREAAAQNKALRLVGHSPAVLEVLDLCNLHGFFGDPVVLTSSFN